MTNLFRNCAAACLVCMSMAVAVADEPGQADLDAAIDAKLSANDLDDYGTVLELCKQAIEKGLDEESRKFADDLYTGTLIDRAGMVVEAIFDSDTPDPQWPRMRSYALRDLNEAIGRDEKLGAAQAYVIRGNLETDKAKRTADYDKAVELSPRDKDVRRTRGLFNLLNDDFQQAQADLGVAIEEAPEDASLLEALGMAYMMDSKLEQAQEAFDKAIKLDPDASGALLQRARVLALRGERPKAIADLDKAMAIDPDDAIPLVLRARIHQQSGDAEQAKKDLAKVFEKHPDHPAALELRGLIAADANDFPAAIRDFRKLVAKNSDDPLLVGQLGLLYLAAKQPREAIRRFSRGLELDDKQFLSRRGRSDAAISIGDHAAALADLNKAAAAIDDLPGVLSRHLPDFAMSLCGRLSLQAGVSPEQLEAYQLSYGEFVDR